MKVVIARSTACTTSQIDNFSGCTCIIYPLQSVRHAWLALSPEDEKGCGQNHGDHRCCETHTREKEQRRRRPTLPYLVDLLFGNGRIARPVMAEHIARQYRDIAVAERVGISRPAAKAWHEGLFARYRAIHSVQDGGNQVGRVFSSGGGVVEEARIVTILAALPFGRMAGGAIALKQLRAGGSCVVVGLDAVAATQAAELGEHFSGREPGTVSSRASDRRDAFDVSGDGIEVVSRKVLEAVLDSFAHASRGLRLSSQMPIAQIGREFVFAPAANAARRI